MIKLKPFQLILACATLLLITACTEPTTTSLQKSTTGMIAVDGGNTDGLLSIILAGPLLSTPIWLEDAQILLSQMPENLQATILEHEKAGTYDHPDSVAATDSFYARFLYHQPQKSIPECEGVNGNPEMYQSMWGPTEFSSTGTLLDYDRTERLNALSMPVMLVSGEFDEARPETMYTFAAMMPNARVEVVADAGHLAMMDKPEEYAARVSTFLAEVESEE